ncbi:MAG: hypothetical protein M1827_003364 [Pycnora praestabilis]|nr:MAG: hypothetical protein M1827_003364 [Pycnora praestabilis]
MLEEASLDGSEDVNDFLRRIRELGDKRDKEDEERTRKLEEEILQGRKERQARRVERARSLSPTKDSSSNVGTPQSSRSVLDTPTHESVFRPNVEQQSPSEAMSRETVLSDTLERLNGTPSKDDQEPKATPSRVLPEPPSAKPSPSAAIAPSRAGTLSWQRRPTSQASNAPRSRPLSMVATENSRTRSRGATPEPISTDDMAVSRSQIAQSLGSKDPAWFRQTADRGKGSAAYRRNQDESTSNTFSEDKLHLPGHSRESTTEPEADLSLQSESTRSPFPSRASSIRGSAGWSNRYSSNSSLSALGGIEGRPALPTSSSQRFDPPASDVASSDGAEQLSLGRTLAMSPSQGRLSPDKFERPVSPTKGLGGFVQSAMLKRSDSVNKRWSTQPSPGLSRGNSIASNRSGFGGSREGLAGLTGPMSPPKFEPRPGSASRETSPMPASRPGSSHSNATVTQEFKENEIPSVAGTDFKSAYDGDFSKPMLPKQSDRFASMAGAEESVTRKRLPVDITPPTSPSRQLDSKRWSPTKASWLESALNKPDSPKPKALPPQQPSWMADMNRAKQQRGSVDAGRAGGFKEVNVGGLMRAPPPGGLSRSPISGALPAISSPRLISSVRSSSPGSQTGAFGMESPPAKLNSLTPSSPPISGPACSNSTSSFSSEIVSDATDDGTGALSYSDAHQGPQRTISEKKQSPAIVSPKPQTPPKKDFRAGLKASGVNGDAINREEPEFKNVFGKLKRTQTQNYVAPDELKNNILRGKAGLSITGGPQKTERKDEFKESLLKQKEAMKAKAPEDGLRGMSRSSSSSSIPQDRGSPTPESLEKQKSLTNTDAALNKPSSSAGKSSSTPEALAMHKSLRAKPRPSPPGKQPASTLISQDKELGSGPGLGHRFNPALVGLLARGPSPVTRAPAGSQPPNDPRLQDIKKVSMKVPDQDEGAHLTHMTKGRARGPKRRPPTSKEDSAIMQAAPAPPTSKPSRLFSDPIAAKATLSPPVETSLNRPLADLRNNNDKAPSTTSSPQQTVPFTKPDVTGSSPIISKQIDKTPEKPKPAAPIKSQLINRKFALPVEECSPTRILSISSNAREDLPSERRLDHQDQQIEQITETAPELKQPAQIQAQDFEYDSNVSVKGAAALWLQSSTTSLSETKGPRSPIKLPTKKDEDAAMENAGLRFPPPKQEQPVGLGLHPMPLKSRPTDLLDTNLPSPPLRSPKSPPLDIPQKPAKKPDRLASRDFSVRGTSNGVRTAKEIPESPIPHTTEASRLFEDFFDEIPTTTDKVEIDTQAVITSRGEDCGKIKTLRKQIWEVTGDGKKHTIPAEQEHILFEESMYLCTHVFGASNGVRTTEIYLWVGDAVSTSAAEDVQLFSRRIAKENNGKLIILSQGRETTNFFQALGGIVITRRGSSSRVGLSTPFMLCGRRHVGQIAFDEVELLPINLCSGFPFIISSPSGKLWLWKGKGSGADELGCARLIGMDLGLTGEIEEVDEGHESKSFFDSFPSGSGKTIPKSADHWRLKASYDKYSSRLFRVDHSTTSKLTSIWSRRPSATESTSEMQVREIAPFCQRDLEPGNIYVVDAFFEVYIVVGSQAQSRFAEFQTALVFAQEYGILAASLEDRPFVPVSTVVFEGVPKDLKAIFRKWEDKHTMTKWEPKRSPSLRVVPLSAAIAATRG